MMAIKYQNLKLRLAPDVYKPAEDSFLLAENLLVDEGDVVLDIGTGTGILALLAAEKAHHVIGTEINPKAVKLARENSRINGIRNVEFLCCDLFPSDEKFDLILFNPPYLPVDDSGLLGKAWSGGSSGIEVIERFLSSVPKYLKPDGIFELLVSSLNDINSVNESLKENKIESKIIAKKRLFFEELYVIKGYLTVTEKY